MNWYLKSKEVEYGPFSFEFLLKIVKNNKVSKADLVRNDSNPEQWISISDMDILTNIIEAEELTGKTYMFPEGCFGWTWFQVVFPTVAVVAIGFQIYLMTKKPSETTQVTQTPKKVLINPDPVEFIIPKKPQPKPVEANPEIYVFQAGAWLQDGQKALAVQKLLFDYMQNIPTYVADQQRQYQQNIRNGDGSVPKSGQTNRAEIKESIEAQQNEVDNIINTIKFYGGLVTGHQDNMKNSIILESVGLDFKAGDPRKDDRVFGLWLHMSIPNSANEINEKHSYKVRIEYNLGEPEIFNVTNPQSIQKGFLNKIKIPIRAAMIPAIKKIFLIKVSNDAFPPDVDE